MQITSEIIFELITLFTTALSFVWYMANQLGAIRSRLDKLEATCQRLSKVEKSIEGIEANCREGRIQIWNTVNEERVKVAEIKAKVEK